MRRYEAQNGSLNLLDMVCTAGLAVGGLDRLGPWTLGRPGHPPGNLGRDAGEKALPTVSFVATILAVVPESQTVLVDVPVGADILRVGVKVTSQTKIEAAVGPPGSTGYDPE